MYNSLTRGVKKPAPRKTIADDLIIGQTYTITAQVYGAYENKSGAYEAPMKMTLIGLFPHCVRFRRKAGYCESFTYWDLARRLRK